MGRHEFDLRFGLRAGLPEGLFAGSRVQTPQGWRLVESLAPGDVVSTHNGPQAVFSVTEELRPAQWSILIPPGALDNRLAVMLPPGQTLMVRSTYAVPYCGAPAALVPAQALEGWRGISLHVPAHTEPALRLMFLRPQIVPAGPGLMIGCAGADPASTNIHSLLSEPLAPMSLSLAAARQLLACVIAEETGSGLQGQAADLRAPPENRA